MSRPRRWLTILALALGFALLLGALADRAEAQAFKPRSRTGLAARLARKGPAGAPATAPAAAAAAPKKSAAPPVAAAKQPPAKKAPAKKKPKGGDDEDEVVVTDGDDE